MNNRQPHNIEAEQSVIGAAFISKSALQKVCEELDNTSFFNEAHGKIFDVLKEIGIKYVELSYHFYIQNQYKL